MVPNRDLDEYGKLLTYGDLDLVRLDFFARGLDAAQQIYGLRWGPTQVPIYNLLALFTRLNPHLRTAYIKIASFLIKEAKVPVDGTDLSGTTALSHCFSTKPGLDFEYAQLLYDAGGDVNHRNRYGCTVAQEIVQVYILNDKTVVANAKKAFEWFLTHGGNVNIADGDGCTVRHMLFATALKYAIPEFIKVLEKEDKRRAAKGDASCKLCGREDKKLLFCGRCKKVRYCQPPGRMCQKTDWPNHKKECKP
jgi:MYND finger